MKHQQPPSDTPSDVLAQEISLNIHILAGTLLDQGWPMKTVQEAIRQADNPPFSDWPQPEKVWEHVDRERLRQIKSGKLG